MSLYTKTMFLSNKMRIYLLVACADRLSLAMIFFFFFFNLLCGDFIQLQRSLHIYKVMATGKKISPFEHCERETTQNKKAPPLI